MRKGTCVSSIMEGEAFLFLEWKGSCFRSFLVKGTEGLSVGQVSLSSREGVSLKEEKGTCLPS